MVLKVGAVVLLAVLAGMCIAVGAKPPTDSAAYASWAQAFGTVLAIGGGAGLALYESQLAVARERKAEDDLHAVVLQLCGAIDGCAATLLTEIIGAPDEHAKLKKLDVDEVGRVLDELNEFSSSEFSTAGRKLALRKVKLNAQMLVDDIRKAHGRSKERDYTPLDEEAKRKTSKRRDLFAATVKRFSDAR
jgi:hypothetical protein